MLSEQAGHQLRYRRLLVQVATHHQVHRFRGVRQRDAGDGITASQAWLTSSVPLPGGSDSIVSIPVTEDPEPMQLVVHRDLHQQAVMAGLVAGLIAQHQQQPIRLHSP